MQITNLNNYKLHLRRVLFYLSLLGVGCSPLHLALRLLVFKFSHFKLAKTALIFTALHCSAIILFRSTSIFPIFLVACPHPQCFRGSGIPILWRELSP